jgi:hypothetical protein
MTRTRRRSRSRALRDARAALFWVAALVALVLVIWAAAHPLMLGALGALVVAAACWRIARPRLERTPGPGRRPVIRGRAGQAAAASPAELLAAERRARAAAESTAADLRAQLAEARAQLAEARAQLAEARESAAAAWDAAASAPPRPRPAPEGDQAARLLGDPMSGARPLVGGDHG